MDNSSSSKFINNLPIKSDSDILWKYKENKDLYNKFTQIILEKEDVKEVVKEDVKEEVKEDVKEDVKEVVKEEVKEIVKEDVKEIVKEDVKEDVKEVVKEDVKEDVKKVKEDVKKVKEDVKKVKEVVKEVKKVLSPLDIIIDHCKSNIAAKDSIKQILIETISRKDYIKIFGLKKSSEIMSGITKDKWNKSLVIFMSFLLDKQITYKGDIILYNAEKNNGNIVL